MMPKTPKPNLGPIDQLFLETRHEPYPPTFRDTGFLLGIKVQSISVLLSEKLLYT